MTLEEILVDLGIPEEQRAPIYGFRDGLIVAKAAELQACRLECEQHVADVEASKGAACEEMAAQLATVTAERDAVQAMAADVIAKAKAALEAGDLDTLAACVAEAEKPAKDREQDAIRAQIEALQAKLEE